MFIFMIMSVMFLLRMRNVTDESNREKRTHIICSVFLKTMSFLRLENYGRVRQATDGNIIQELTDYVIVDLCKFDFM